MKRYLLPLVAALLVFTSAAQAAEFQLRARALVDSDVVRLGDVLDGAGLAADAVIARAPAPGQRMVIGLSYLLKVARANGLDWRPMRGLDRVVVRRASQVIGRIDIERRLREALAEAVPGEHLRIELPKRIAEIHLPTDVTPTLDVENFSFDRQSGRFSAILVAGNGRYSDARSQINGRAFAVVDVPVPRHALRRGDVIGKNDIDWLEMRVDRVASATVIDPDDLIGKASRRTLKAGKPVRDSDVGPPIVVTKGSNVIMAYRTAAMVLTSTGRALQAGAIGDTIRVLNTHSNVVIEARIEGGNVVSVASNQRLALD